MAKGLISYDFLNNKIEGFIKTKNRVFSVFLFKRDYLLIGEKMGIIELVHLG